jgi:uncharacterized protein YqfB (UPF0267 family)
MGLFYLFKTCIMAVRKIFTGDAKSESHTHELKVVQHEKSIVIDIDMKTIQPSFIVLDLETLNEFVRELYRLEKKINNEIQQEHLDKVIKNKYNENDNDSLDKLF